MNRHQSTAAPILAVLAIVVAFVGAYAGGYFLFGEEGITITEELTSGPDGRAISTTLHSGIVREYPQQWLSVIYRPAGNLEAWLRRTDVEITWPGAE